MNTIVGRLKNAFETGGIKEILRKLSYKVIYDYNGKKIKENVKYGKFEYGLCKENTRDYEVVVTLTTYPKRFPYIELVLKSLILQKEKPNHIIVYLGSDANDVELPKTMEKFQKYGVIFKRDKDKNLRSHKKYYYAMKEFPTAVVVTADDDIIYPSDWLKSLLESYEKYPSAISARRVHLITKDSKGNLNPYNHWIDQYRKLNEPSHCIIATGNAGILYPPNCLDERVFDLESIYENCFEADDIWLKFMALLKGTKYVWVKNYAVDLPEVEGAKQTGLASENVVAFKNDDYIKKMMKKYNISSSDFFKN